MCWAFVGGETLISPANRRKVRCSFGLDCINCIHERQQSTSGFPLFKVDEIQTVVLTPPQDSLAFLTPCFKMFSKSIPCGAGGFDCG